MRGVCRDIAHLAAVSGKSLRRKPAGAATLAGGATWLSRQSTRYQTRRSWILFADSHGGPDRFRCRRDRVVSAINANGNANAEDERLVKAARGNALRIAFLGLSNACGGTRDHADLIVPAFARIALASVALHAQGTGHIFEFTRRGSPGRSSAC